jgi:tripartite-type tricarboxylate transporter receptor subunit TctC
MEIQRRQFLHLAPIAVAVPAVSSIAWAQAYPSRPVKIIVGFGAGGGANFGARLIGEWVSERLGQQFRPGCRKLAAEAVVRAPPDGYTLFLVTSVNASNAALYEKLNFDLIRDIVPVAGIHRGIGIVVANLSFPAKTLTEFIAYAKTNPDKIRSSARGPWTKRRSGAASCRVLRARGCGSATRIHGRQFAGSRDCPWTPEAWAN